jgi:hypothetical protein
MTNVKMLYQCNCGKFILIEGTKIMDTAIAMTDAVFDHEDVTCG